MRRRRPSGGSASTAATIVSAAPFTSSSVVPISVVLSSGMPSDAKTASRQTSWNSQSSIASAVTPAERSASSRKDSSSRCGAGQRSSNTVSASRKAMEHSPSMHSAHLAITQPPSPLETRAVAIASSDDTRCSLVPFANTDAGSRPRTLSCCSPGSLTTRMVSWSPARTTSVATTPPWRPYLQALERAFRWTRQSRRWSMSTTGSGEGCVVSGNRSLICQARPSACSILHGAVRGR
mmetsp:Transcript_17815/g.58628  ORF Transcript_17815/g.58628 Transcript_17815/m.58628 type:complete len:236 (-) Transcript_17815:357-1064(-)